MIELSKYIIGSLDKILAKENTYLPYLVDKNYISDKLLSDLNPIKKVHCNIAVVAPVSAGKSTLFNALCGYPILPAATGVTSSVPTYINHANSHNDECVKVCGLKKVNEKVNGVEYTRFVKSSESISFKANDIKEAMFNELFDYMFLVMHGDEKGNIQTTVENVAYFMQNKEKSNILFCGTDAQKYELTKEDYALEYKNPRHRLLLLLILLCVYVEQNTDKKNMGVYVKKINEEREKLLKKYKIPFNTDYCVYLDWCSDDLPEDVTLIDLPGTGSSTEDNGSQSSHTRLVEGILEEADAIWVLCSANGTVDIDMMNALKNVTVGNIKKNKVCIYNCKDNNPNNSVPVRDFLKLLPSFAGERCYVVNALAGEYKYTQNNVNGLMTVTAARKIDLDDDETPAEQSKRVEKKLSNMYNGERHAYCTFTTGRDSDNNITIVQDINTKYTLKTFFESALTDYIGRLKYELALKQFIEQSDFYVSVRDALASSRDILDGLKGQDKQISEVIITALKNATNAAILQYTTEAQKSKKSLDKKIEPLSEKLNDTVKTEFLSCLHKLISSIKAEWNTLIEPGHVNCMESNIFGQYGMGPDNPNLIKFQRVCNITKAKINASAFESALKLADNEIGEFRNLLVDYTNSLKTITENFKNNYIYTFLQEFDKEQKKIIQSEKNVTQNMVDDFKSARARLKKEMENSLDKECKKISDGFDELVSEEGIFADLREKTADAFRMLYCDAVLASINNDLITPYNNIRKQFLGSYGKDEWRFTNSRAIHNLLNTDFQAKEAKYEKNLENLINAVYGNNLGTEGSTNINFPQSLSYETEKFANQKITAGATEQINGLHKTFSSMIKVVAEGVLDVEKTIRDLNAYIKSWVAIKEDFSVLGKTLKSSDVERTQKLYLGCMEKMKTITAEKTNK